MVVLAGGASRRFGADKLAADLGGRTVLARCLDAVAAALPGAPVVVVGPASRRGDARGADVVTEDPPGSGPAAGVLAGARHLARTSAPDVVAVVPGDAPWAGSVLPRLVAALGPAPDEGADADAVAGAAVAVAPDGRRQHLLLAVRAEHLGRHGAGDLDGAPARALVEGLRLALVEVDERAVLDVDDPAALARARARLGAVGEPDSAAAAAALGHDGGVDHETASSDPHDAPDARPGPGDGSARTGGEPSAHNTGTAAGEAGLAQRLSEMARDLQRTSEPPDVMEHVVRAAVALVPGAQEGSISLVRGRRRVTSQGASGELGRLMDELQEETGQGPCLDAVFERETVRVEDLAADQRWPDLAARAAEAGIHGALCLQLFVDGDDLGALNLISREPDAFGDESEQVGLLLASHAAVAVSDALQLEGATRALANRDLIGQAKGVLMERFKLPPQQAFDLLAQVSQNTNRRLVDVAEELTTSGQLGP